MRQNKIFQSSVKIWVNQFIYMLIGIAVALLLLLILINMLNMDTAQYYDKYIQMGIMLFGFIGMLFGSNRIYGVIRDNKMYLSRKTKYLVAIYQIIIFLGFGAICLAYKLSVIYFVGAYLSIFLQFLLNYYYTKYNNFKFPKGSKKTKNVKANKNSNEGMIDVEALQ